MQSKLSKKELLDIIQWDVKTWGKTLHFWEKHAEIKEGMSVLAIGEREGGLSLWLAKKGLQVACTDFRDFPETTKKLHKEYGVEDKISYEEGVDVTDLCRYPENSFDIVVFKSVIGALSEKEKQKTALNQIHKVLKPGGRLIFAENLKGTKLHRKLREKFIKWNTYWRYLDLKNDQDLFEKYSKKTFKTAGFLANFGRGEGQRSVLAFWDKLNLWWIPKNWRYVLFGVLTK